jgi:hypothetical protein
MKLLRWGSPGNEKPGILETNGTIRSLASLVDDLRGASLSRISLERIEYCDLSTLPVVDTSQRLGPCVAGVGKIICVGLNYSDRS